MQFGLTVKTILLVAEGEKKSRSALCSKTTVKKCMKYNVKLHEACFSAFHGLTE